MWVIKLGGSLVKTADITDWLKLVAEQGRGKLVIVPGGGVFADCVRQEQQRLQLSDAVAHVLAIQAMQQMALVFQDLQADLVIAESIEQIQLSLSNNKSVIWSPDINWLNQQNIAASWDITSDSLSVLLANCLAAERLILVKSVAISEDISIAQCSKHGYVDKGFEKTVENVLFNIDLIHKYDIKSMVNLLANYHSEH